MIAKFIAPPRLRKPLEIFGFDLHHAAIAFGLVIGEGRSRIDGEAQNVLLARGEAQEEIESGSTPLAAKPRRDQLRRPAVRWLPTPIAIVSN
jgi:hypothetical protein